jgi:hypothetical protein
MICKSCHHEKFKYKPTSPNLTGIDKCKCKCHYGKEQKK